jgi:hypothetical protein
MIAGIIAQESRVPPKGTIPFKLFFDDDSLFGAVISTDADQLVFANLALDAVENIFHADMPKALVPDFFPIDVTEFVFRPLIAQDQRLLFLLHNATDVFFQPDIRIPGTLQAPFHVDLDVVFATPLILAPGMLRAEVYFDFDSFIPATIAVIQTLAPAQVAAADVFFSPRARIGVGPGFFLSDDYIPAFISTGAHAAGLVFDSARPVTAIATFDGLATGVTLSPDNLTATHNNYNNYCGARSTLIRSTEKFYFEVAIGQTHGFVDCIGIVTTTATYQDLAQGANCVAVYAIIGDGGIIVTQSARSGFFLGTLVDGDIVGVAIDFTNRLAWFRKNGGHWNGQSSGHDPAATLGGVYIPIGDWVPAIGFGSQAGVGGPYAGLPGDNMTANFGQSAFTMDPPAGFDNWQAPSPFAPSGTADRFGETYIVSPATFDGPPYLAVMSNGNLTATRSGGPFSMAMSASSQNYGRFYFEVTIDSTHGSEDCLGISFGTNSQSFDGGTNCTVLYCNNTGNDAIIWSNYRNSGSSLGRPLVAGDIIGVAVDITNQSKTFGGNTWFSLNGGPWNGDASADPFVGAGGVAVSGANYALNWFPAVGFGGTNSTLGDQMTANFGQIPFALTKPGGYSPWPTKILQVVQGLVAALVADDVDTESLPLPFADTSIKNLYVVDVLDDTLVEAIFGSASFGGNLFLGAATVVQDQDAIFSPGTYGSLAGGFESPNVTVSNNSRTATLTTSINNTGARSISFQNVGKYYFEVNCDKINSSDCAGVLLSNGTYANMVNNGTNCVSIFASNGTIWSNNGSSGKTLGAILSGNVLSFAIDLVARRAWIRKSGGPWNGDALANPATNTGGVAVGAGAFAPAFAFGGGGQQINDAWTGNFGQSPFAYLVPTGFGAGWPASSVLTLLNSNLVAVDDAFPTPTVILYTRFLAPGIVTDADSLFAVAKVGSTSATFDGTPSNVTLTNTNLTATHANTTNNSGARSNSNQSTGKFYFEVAVTTTHGAFDCVGILTAAGTYTDLVTSGVNCMAIYKGTGNISSNNANSGRTLGAIALGDTIGVAVDLAARRGWIRKNGGNWNGLAIGSENPATGLGGVVVAATVSFAPAVGFGGSGTAANDAMTANFGDTAFQAAAPVGFANWPIS